MPHSDRQPLAPIIARLIAHGPALLRVLLRLRFLKTRVREYQSSSSMPLRKPKSSIELVSKMTPQSISLHNQDIMYTVFRHLDPRPGLSFPDNIYHERPSSTSQQRHQLTNLAPEDGRENAMTLARAARVCHAFLAPALDILWRSLPDATILIKACLSLEYNDILCTLASTNAFDIPNIRTHAGCLPCRF